MNEIDEKFECPECGASVEEGDKICHKCKYKLTWEYEDIEDEDWEIEKEEIEEDKYEKLKDEVKLDKNNADKVEISVNDDLLFITVGMYKMFLKLEHGRDALLLYIHLMFAARLQKTNSVWAVNSYIMKGLGWGEDKVKRTKAILKKIGLIKYIRRIDPKTKRYTKVYIELTNLWPLKTLEKRVHKLVQDRKLKKRNIKKVDIKGKRKVHN